MKKTLTPLKTVLFIAFVAFFSCQEEEISTDDSVNNNIQGKTAKNLNITGKSSSETVKTVTDCNLNGWIKQPTGNSTLGFVNGPATPALGKGSLKFYVPAGVNFPGDFVRFRNGQYSGTKLSSLTTLSYDTYIEERETPLDIHFIVVLSDINGDGTADHNLVFDPRYQNSNFIRSTMPDQEFSKVHEWQRWDAFSGGWFYGGDTTTDPDHGGGNFLRWRNI